jgi:membrane protein implicated in regulation of membrane protease activity
VEEEDTFAWYDWIVLTLVVLLALFAVVGIYPGWVRVADALASNNAPAWVQALGSVAAIAVAFLVPYLQNRRDRARRESLEFERRVRNTQMAISAVSYVSYVARNIRTRLSEHEIVDARPLTHEVSMLRSFCERFPVMSLENAEITARFFGVLEAVVSLEAEFMGACPEFCV